MNIKVNDYVDVTYKSSSFYGKVTHVDEKHAEGTVTFAPGVTMILPLADMTAVTERAEEEEN